MQVQAVLRMRMVNLCLPTHMQLQLRMQRERKGRHRCLMRHAVLLLLLLMMMLMLLLLAVVLTVAVMMLRMFEGSRQSVSHGARLAGKERQGRRCPAAAGDECCAG